MRSTSDQRSAQSSPRRAPVSAPRKRSAPGPARLPRRSATMARTSSGSVRRPAPAAGGGLAFRATLAIDHVPLLRLVQRRPDEGVDPAHGGRLVALVGELGVQGVEVAGGEPVKSDLAELGPDDTLGDVPVLPHRGGRPSERFAVI